MQAPWGTGVSVARPIPGCLVLPKAKAENVQETSQSFHWTSIWLQSRARRPDNSRSGKRQKTQASTAARKMPPNANVHMRPAGGAGGRAGPT